MDKFTKRLLQFIRQEHLISQGDSVIAGYSGGADSTCLLYALSELSALLRLRLFAVHVNHGLRGAESMRDEQFCVETAAHLGIPLQVVRADVRARAEQDSVSLEEAGRMIRYEAFEEARKKLLALQQKFPEAEGDGSGGSNSRRCRCGERAESGRVLIATAHHADDQAETILLNLFRGTGLSGLSGMHVRRGPVIRPLLFASQREIAEWLSGRNIPYVTDSSNLSEDYTRNFLRNRILPELSEHVNARTAQHIRAAGQFCGEADCYLREEARAFLAHFAECREVFGETVKNIKIPHIPLKEKPQIFRRYVIIEALGCLCAPLRNIGERHLADLDKALFAGRGFHLDLPNGISADNLYQVTVLQISEKDQRTNKAVNSIKPDRI